MNHTIKGVILVIVITSMLFVGATSMFPIMQNSFASKKFDVKQADRNANANTNTNTNTNSADSTSSSTATASNTNNINNSACTVTVSTCPKGSTSVTSTPTTGTLIIFKECHGCVSAFPITVTGNNPKPSSFTLTNLHFKDVILGPGSFTVHESVPPRFTPTFGGDCTQTAPRSSDATGTISAGQTLTCGIINNG